MPFKYAWKSYSVEAPGVAAVAFRWALEALDLTLEQGPLAFISHLEQILNENAHGRVASQVPAEHSLHPESASLVDSSPFNALAVSDRPFSPS